MKYGGSTDAGRALGRTGDDGVDGVIDQDALGLDRVYIQAKRYAEGTAVRLQIKSAKDISPVKILAAIKLENSR